ncbi:MAG TPA: HAD-IIIA family hydrolase, partial [Polyangia bacterium]|nr:HAD-IIIA family hydrolase [Polyangia bacterium]
MARPEIATAGTLIVLDRDGVLNRLLEKPSELRPDSPMRPSEVEVFPWVPAVLRELTAAGFGLVIASNQPAAAKGKTTRAELEAAHAEVLRAATTSGGVILSSHLCFHRAEDGCACRKPATGLLEEAFARHSTFTRAGSWMVGDRAPDVLAGTSFGLQTAYLGDVASDDYATLAA